MLKCWLFGHKPLLLDSLGKSLITIYDGHYSKPIALVSMCERCKLVYWESSLWD